MAVLGRDEFFERLDSHLTDSTSEEDIQWLEDMTDTYNDLEQRANGGGEDWEQRYYENDRKWKERYRHRFFTSDGGNVGTPSDSGGNGESAEERAKRITIEDLFN